MGPAGIFPGYDQEHIGRVSTERPAGGGLLSWMRIGDCDRQQIYGGLCVDGGFVGLVHQV